MSKRRLYSLQRISVLINNLGENLKHSKPRFDSNLLSMHLNTENKRHAFASSLLYMQNKNGLIVINLKFTHPKIFQQKYDFFGMCKNRLNSMMLAKSENIHVLVQHSEVRKNTYVRYQFHYQYSTYHLPLRVDSLVPAGGPSDPCRRRLTKHLLGRLYSHINMSEHTLQ